MRFGAEAGSFLRHRAQDRAAIRSCGSSAGAASKSPPCDPLRRPSWSCRRVLIFAMREKRPTSTRSSPRSSAARKPPAGALNPPVGRRFRALGPRSLFEERCGQKEKIGVRALPHRWQSHWPWCLRLSVRHIPPVGSHVADGLRPA